MTPQERSDKLAKIYEVIANKELSFGCMLDVWYPDVHYVRVIARLSSNSYKICNHHRKTKYEWMQDIVEYKDNFSIERTPIPEITKIIGHPVMIGDCLDWNDTINQLIVDFEYHQEMILDLWKSKRLPIDEQSDECVSYIHSLIK